MTNYLKKIFRQKEETLTERTLRRFNEHKPVSKSVRGMFADETSETFKKRFAKARQKVAEVA